MSYSGMIFIRLWEAKVKFIFEKHQIDLVKILKNNFSGTIELKIINEN